jgi:hypothetical protein
MGELASRGMRSSRSVLRDGVTTKRRLPWLCTSGLPYKTRDTPGLIAKLAHLFVFSHVKPQEITELVHVGLQFT